MENGWSLDRVKILFDNVKTANKDGQPLSRVFEKTAEKTGFSAGSVRNYYYAQARLFKLMPALAEEMGVPLSQNRAKPFVTFDKGEVVELIKSVLSGKAQGKSVRKTVTELALGDAKIALRYQNKYRSVLVRHERMVREAMRSLSDAGKSFYDPYAKVTRFPSSENQNVSEREVSSMA